MADTVAMLNQHASCVSFHDAGILILGASGTGKSALALQLMAFGAELIADDQTFLRKDGNVLTASSPSAIDGLIEARCVGLLCAASGGPAEIKLVVDMDRQETARLPQAHCIEIGGVRLPCLYYVDAPYFAAALVQYIKGGRQAP